MDDQRLGRVADTRTTRLRVHHDVERAVEISRLIHVDLAVAVTVDDHRDRRVLPNALDQRVAAARNEAVDGVELHQLDGGLVTNIVDEHDAIRGESRLGRRVA